MKLSEQLGPPPPEALGYTFTGWQRLERAGNNRKNQDKVIKREILQYLAQNQHHGEILEEEELFRLNSYNQQANEFFRELDTQGRLNDAQRRILARFGSLPAPETRVSQQEVAFFCDPKQSDPPALTKIIKDRNFVIRKNILKEEERKARDLIEKFFPKEENLTAAQILDRWNNILRFQFPWGLPPPERLQTTERQEERIDALNLIQALETKRLGRNGKLSSQERMLANTAFYHLLRTNMAAGIFNADPPTASSGIFYVDFLRRLYTVGHKTQEEVDTEAWTKLGRNFAFLLLSLSILQGTADSQSLPSLLFQGLMKTVANTTQAIRENREFIQKTLVASPEIVRKIGDQAIGWALDTFVGGEKYPYVPITEMGTSVTFTKKAPEKVVFRETGQTSLPNGPNGEKISGKFLIPENTPQTVAFDKKQWILDPTRVSQTGGLVWKSSSEYLTLINGQPTRLESQKIQRYTYQPRVVSHSQTALSSEKRPIVIPNQAFTKIPLPVIEVPATAPALPDEIDITRPDGRRAVLNQKPELGNFQPDFSRYPVARLYYEPEPGSSKSYFVHELNKNNELHLVGYVDATNGLQIVNDQTVSIPDHPGKFYWKGHYLPGAREYPADTFVPLFVPLKDGEQVSSPAAILIQEGAKPVLAFRDEKNPGYYQTAGQTQITVTRRISPTPAEKESLGAKIKELTRLGRGWEAQRVNDEFEKAHTVTEKIEVSNRFFAANGTYVGYGMDQNGRGPTHYVEVREAKVIGQPEQVIVRVKKQTPVPGTLLQVFSIDFSLSQQPGNPGENLLKPVNLEKLKPVEIILSNGEAAVPVPGQADLYATKDNTVVFKIIGTGENAQVLVNTAPR